MPTWEIRKARALLQRRRPRYYRPHVLKHSLAWRTYMLMPERPERISARGLTPFFRFSRRNALAKREMLDLHVHASLPLGGNEERRLTIERNADGAARAARRRMADRNEDFNWYPRCSSRESFLLSSSSSSAAAAVMLFLRSVFYFVKNVGAVAFFRCFSPTYPFFIFFIFASEIYRGHVFILRSSHAREMSGILTHEC